MELKSSPLLIFAHELAAERLRLREIERRHAHGGGRHFIDEMHEGAHACALNRILRREAVARLDLVEVFDDDRRIDDDCTIVIERGHDPIGIELEVVRLELIALKQVQLHFVERQLLGIEDKTDTLAAGRLWRVIKLESHEELLTPLIQAEDAALHILHEIYEHFTCGYSVGSFQWTCAQPLFSSLKA